MIVAEDVKEDAAGKNLISANAETDSTAVAKGKEDAVCAIFSVVAEEGAVVTIAVTKGVATGVSFNINILSGSRIKEI